jgi:hypothetical protein
MSWSNEYRGTRTGRPRSAGRGQGHIKLHALRLRVLAGTWLEQDKSADTLALSFDERLALLVDAEMLARENARLARNLREAKLRILDACIEGIDFRRERQLDKAVVRQLAGCRWVDEH